MVYVLLSRVMIFLVISVIMALVSAAMRVIHEVIRIIVMLGLHTLLMLCHKAVIDDLAFHVYS